ncbi:hypothetical protein E4665_17265 [Sporolactobacillus shoreae]|uniref:Uncharacterized protein n=1 Tax=Sporolactobacillus shoreae TaxID=1465501 RepID=A0A4Z0GGU6_9BACL|nr:hypothetical protein [Sporolactobacillus shoreae]TGA95864.1 hypothetical protein E4665_17265 [Sporolactobacillus shoreae]
MNRDLVLRTGGFGLYFLSALAALFIYVPFLDLKSVISIFTDFQVFYIICIIFYFYLTLYLIGFIFSHKIKLTDSYLSVRVINKFLIFKTDRMRLGDIEKIYLGSRSFLYEGIKDSRGRKKLGMFDDRIMKAKTIFPITLAIWTNDGDLHLFSTKPYSKRGFQRLFEELHYRDMDVLVEENIL